MAPRTRLQAGRSSSLRERLRAHPECGYLFGLQELPPTLMASLFNRFRCSLFSGSEALHARPLHSGRRFVDENDNEDFALQLVTGSAKVHRRGQSPAVHARPHPPRSKAPLRRALSSHPTGGPSPRLVCQLSSPRADLARRPYCHPSSLAASSLIATSRVA